MDYVWHYNSLISSRKRRELNKNTYYESHHIVMRSMGGTDDAENIVNLTAREHFIAHLLLWKIHNNRETAAAFGCMTNLLIKRNGYIPSSRLFEFSRIAAAESAKEQITKRNLEYWSRFSPEERKILTSRLRKTLGTPERTEKVKQRWKNKSDEEMKLFSEKLRKSKEKRTLFNAELKKKKLESRVREYPELICPVCNKRGKSGVMKRWHFNNCKQ